MPATVLVPASSSGTATTFASSTALEASNVVSAATANLYGFYGYNSGSAQYIQIHNASSLPADTAVPTIVIRAEAQRNFSFDAGTHPLYFSTGIVICNSSTIATKTIGSADCFFGVQYK